MDQKTKAYRRQIRTTVTPEMERLIDGLCAERGQKESVIVREALMQYLQSTLTAEMIASFRGLQFHQPVPGS